MPYELIGPLLMTPIGTTPFRLIYVKHCHLVELEHRVYWAVKTLNYNLKIAGVKRLLDINEPDEVCLDASALLIRTKPKSGTINA